MLSYLYTRRKTHIMNTFDKYLLYQPLSFLQMLLGLALVRSLAFSILYCCFFTKNVINDVYGSVHGHELTYTEIQLIGNRTTLP